MSKSVEQVQRENAAHFMERGPALSRGYQAYVIARRPQDAHVLLGGLGSMGVGQMWVPETEEHQGYPGYEDAAILTWDEPEDPS